MSKQASRADYSARMHRVLEHIDRHLDHELNLHALASVAHFSAFHFHRLFLSWTGETLGDYLSRRRLEVAATRLAGQPKLPILDVAISVGFGSTEAFGRAFKVRFGSAPSIWRTSRAQQGNSDQQLRNPDQIGGASIINNGSSRYKGSAMNVKIIERRAVKVTYLRHVGAYGQPLSEFWQRTVYPWMEANDQLGQPRYGISLDDPTITAADKCRYDAGVETRGSITLPGEAHTTTIPGGQYAVTAFRGTADQIGDVWNGMLREWLPNSGMQLDSRPFLEYYPPDASFDPGTGVFTCDILIPVAPL